MFSYLTFAAVDLDMEKVRPISELFVWIMGFLVVFTIFYILWHFIRAYWGYRGEKADADRTISLNSKESVLYRGHRSLEVPENSLEYFVCKLVFEELDEPQLDVNVLEAAGKDPLDQRAVYQAVRRLNGKAKLALQLKGDLLKRGKEKTALNDIERLI